MNSEEKMEHMNFLLQEIKILEGKVRVHDRGPIRTTINTLEQRVKEVQDEILRGEGKN